MMQIDVQFRKTRRKWTVHAPERHTYSRRASDNLGAIYEYVLVALHQLSQQSLIVPVGITVVPFQACSDSFPNLPNNIATVQSCLKRRTTSRAESRQVLRAFLPPSH